tara:strand:- start:292 stop:450 length:159 start_codon:yes stop_codon:yes gene_type:complete
MGKIKALVTEHGWEKAGRIIAKIKHNKKVKSSCEIKNKSVTSCTKKGERKCH